MKTKFVVAFTFLTIVSVAAIYVGFIFCSGKSAILNLWIVLGIQTALIVGMGHILMRNTTNPLNKMVSLTQDGGTADNLRKSMINYGKGLKLIYITYGWVSDVD